MIRYLKSRASLAAAVSLLSRCDCRDDYLVICPLCQHSGPYLPLSFWIGSTYGIGLFWCKEDDILCIEPLLTAASLPLFWCGGGGPSFRFYIYILNDMPRIDPAFLTRGHASWTG
jgi:hypothetical protein